MWMRNALPSLRSSYTSVLCLWFSAAHLSKPFTVSPRSFIRDALRADALYGFDQCGSSVFLTTSSSEAIYSYHFCCCESVYMEDWSFPIHAVYLIFLSNACALLHNVVCLFWCTCSLSVLCKRKLVICSPLKRPKLAHDPLIKKFGYYWKNRAWWYKRIRYGSSKPVPLITFAHSHFSTELWKAE